MGVMMALSDILETNDGRSLRFINTPKGFSSEVETDTDGDGVLVFAHNTLELAEHGIAALEATRQEGPAWIAYPKAGKLATDLNRDELAARLKGEGFRPVHQVSVDDTWAAVRLGSLY